MPDPMAPRITISTLPTDVLTFVLHNIDQEDVAALRCVCRSLRLAVDLTVTHATFHPNVDAAELGSTTQRCTGEVMCSDPSRLCSKCGNVPSICSCACACHGSGSQATQPAVLHLRSSAQRQTAAASPRSCIRDIGGAYGSATPTQPRHAVSSAPPAPMHAHCARLSVA